MSRGSLFARAHTPSRANGKFATASFAERPRLGERASGCTVLLAGRGAPKSSAYLVELIQVEAVVEREHPAPGARQTAAAPHICKRKVGAPPHRGERRAVIATHATPSHCERQATEPGARVGPVRACVRACVVSAAVCSAAHPNPLLASVGRPPPFIRTSPGRRACPMTGHAWRVKPPPPGGGGRRAHGALANTKEEHTGKVENANVAIPTSVPALHCAPASRSLLLEPIAPQRSEGSAAAMVRVRAKGDRA